MGARVVAALDAVADALDDHARAIELRAHAVRIGEPAHDGDRAVDVPARAPRQLHGLTEEPELEITIRRLRLAEDILGLGLKRDRRVQLELSPSVGRGG